MAKVAKGDMRARVETGLKDDVGELVNSFNQMVEGLKSHVNRDEEYSKILEEKIEERTRELKESMMELTRFKTSTLNIMEDVNEWEKKN